MQECNDIKIKCTKIVKQKCVEDPNVNNTYENTYDHY